MQETHGNHFSGWVAVFRGRDLPEKALLAGYSALIGAYNLSVPLPKTLFATGSHHRILEKGGWRILTPRHTPKATLEGHLTFAIKYEGLDLALLKQLFLILDPENIVSLVRAQPTGRYARRIWFLYEWLIGRTLDLPNANMGTYVPVVNPDQQWAIPGTPSARHRVKNNLPGTPAFCPLVFRTPALERFIEMDLLKSARTIAANLSHDILARTAAFLLLKDSRSSYAIEGEVAPHDRVQRWGHVIGNAGRRPISLEELLRLQRIVINDTRFVELGLRKKGGFVGEHDPETRLPLPNHISARPEDLSALMDGLIAFDTGPAQKLDVIIAAAILSFGFLYIHPFEDGNGRLHRYLIHHVLAERGLNPPGLVFPISATILERMDAYRAVLEDYSQRLLPVIEWEPTADGNVRVLNNTGDFYRFFDATRQVEFLYACVQKTIEEDIPNEAAFLKQYDSFRVEVKTIVNMPDQTIDLLFHFLRQNNGSLSKRAREREFAKLTPQEITQVEQLYKKDFTRRLREEIDDLLSRPHH